MVLEDHQSNILFLQNSAIDNWWHPGKHKAVMKLNPWVQNYYLKKMTKILSLL